MISKRIVISFKMEKNNNRKSQKRKKCENIIIEEKRNGQKFRKTSDDNAEIEKLKKELESLSGVNNILKWKITKKKLDELMKKKIEEETEESGTSEKFLPKKTKKNSNILLNHLDVVGDRLLPPQKEYVDHLQKMSVYERKKWELYNSYKKRSSLLSGSTYHSSRDNEIEYCFSCQVMKIVDKETSITTCPRCSKTQSFASHVFDAQEIEKDEMKLSKQPSLLHMAKFIAQFERGFSRPSDKVLEIAINNYFKIHTRDPSKVQSSKTLPLIKDDPNCPKLFNKMIERLSLELTGKSIAEFTRKEISNLLNQKNDISILFKTEELESSSFDDFPRKSNNNQVNIRTMGRSSGFEQARLFPLSKTTNVEQQQDIMEE